MTDPAEEATAAVSDSFDAMEGVVNSPRCAAPAKEWIPSPSRISLENHLRVS